MLRFRTPPRLPAALALGLVATLSPRAQATWSIVMTDTETGEVAIASATCINNFNLEFWLPVVRVGIGAAAAQAAVDSTAKNRVIMWDELGKGTPPDVILQLVQAQDNFFQARQIGIADLQGRTATHTGSSTMAYAGDAHGNIGSIAYALQGNILAGKAVLTKAKNALLQTEGDLADRMMAVMLAAQAMGGDGRCSCSMSAPTSCGSPPPSFTKSAHVGFMIIARIGDTEGVCSQQTGCATGDYYMNLNVTQTPAGTDPVFVLQGMFQAWRQSWIGRPDHIRSEVELDPPVLDPQGSGVLTIQLKDWQGTNVPTGGAQITVTQEDGPPGFATFGSVLDLGNGRYEIPLLANGIAGEATYRIVADDGQGKVTLYPFTRVPTAPKDGLSAGVSALSASSGGAMPFAFAGGSALSDRPYVLLASATGTQPGFALGPVVVPLVLDAATLLSFQFCNTAILQNTCGILDAAGAASMSGSFQPGDLAPVVGSTIHFSLITMNPVDYASDPVSVSITP